MTEITSRLSTALADRYRIERELGQGGMATVYLAEDIKHDRKVALKVLKPELAAVLGAERFVQEIKTTANLQHPHILPLFDSGEADSFLYYVMPFIDGETLRDKLDRETQLGVDEAVKITVHVADALDYAHRQGVIHRDIKPENILLHDGRPVVADFGIALAVSAAAGGRMTETGLSLGTPHYMSPEQATAEKEITNRADIYSVGSVLYEMLTGEPPHTGATAQAIIMKIVTEDAAPVTKVRKSVPSNVAAATAKSLEKLPADRFETAASFAAALQSPDFATSGGTVVSPAHRPGPGHTSRATLGLAALSTLLAALLIWTWSPPSSDSADVIRVNLKFQSTPTFLRGYGTSMALAPDGRSMVRSATMNGPAGELWVRRWDRLQEEPLRGVAGAYQPVYSPDGKSVAYTTALNDLYVYSIVNGTQTMALDSGLTDVSIRGGGIAWGSDGFLYGSGLGGLIRVAPEGGVVEQVTLLDSARGETAHAWPDVLPNGRGALVTVMRGNAADFEAHVVAVADFATGSVTEIFQGVFARHSPTGQVIVVLPDGALVAVPFDQNSMEITGEAVALRDSVDIGPTAGAELDISQSGVMAYVPRREVAHQLVWVDRSGRAEEPFPDWAAELNNPALSPDGSLISVSVLADDGFHLWVRSLGGEPPVRLSFGGSNNTRAEWTPDGRSLTYISDQLGPTQVVMVRADGSGGEVAIATGDPRPVFGQGWSPDGRWLIMRTDNQVSGAGDIIAIRPGVDTLARVLVGSPAEELSPSVSPDGRWLAYVSAVTGRREVYLIPFLGPADNPLRVSRDGGSEPVWSRSGSELFFRSTADSLMSVEVLPGPRMGRRQALFSTRRYRGHEFHRNYAPSVDDQRFLMVRGAEDEDFVVVFNWDDEIRELFGR